MWKKLADHFETLRADLSAYRELFILGMAAGVALALLFLMAGYFMMAFSVVPFGVVLQQQDDDDDTPAEPEPEPPKPVGPPPGHTGDDPIGQG